MRAIIFVLLMLICVSGPVYYLTAGAEARRQRHAGLESARATASEVRSLLQQHQPRSQHQLEEGRARLRERIGALDRFADHLTAAFQAAAPTDEQIQRSGAAAGVDRAFLQPVTGRVGDEALTLGRRRALMAVLGALTAAGSPTCESLHIGKSLSVTPWDLPIDLLRVTVTTVGSPTEAIRFAERIITGSDQDPPGDLVEATLTRVPEQEWLRIGQRGQAPPVRLALVVELVVGKRN